MQSATSGDYIGSRNRGEWRLPPGLRKPLQAYIRRPWLNFGDPIPLFLHLHKTFGRIAHYRFLGMMIVFVNDPDWIGEILINQSTSFVKERTVQRMKVLLGEGLITSEDPTHMRQRKLAAPAFHRQRIAGYASEIVRSAEEQTASWKDGATVDIGDEMMRLSLRIVARTLFATEVTADVLSVVDEVNTIMGMYNFLVVFPMVEKFLKWPLPYISRFRKAKSRLDVVVDRMIANRRALPLPDLQGRHDLLSTLVAARYEAEDTSDGATDTGMSDTQIRDEVLTIFLAGYETVANALTWTWYLLSQNPACAERMFAEVDEVLGDRTATLADVPNLRYTEMVFAESMRLFPPAWAMGRKSTAPIELGPYRIPPGTSFFFSQYIIGRAPEFWDDPEAFRPERHTPEAKAARHRFVYFPFGAGRRQCIGESFAWMEGILSIATVAQRWRLELIPGQTVIPQARITLRPRFPLHMRLVARSAAQTASVPARVA
jgi:cytochrome P450